MKPLFALILGLFFYSPHSFAKNQSPNQKSESPPSKLSSEKTDKAQPSKKTSVSKSANPLSKERLLAQSYYKAKKSARQLSKELNSHLSDLQTVCLSKESLNSELTNKLELFRDFLKDNLKDPYMVYKYKLEFGDILDLIGAEEDSHYPLSAKDFASSYRRFYNLPDNMEMENYPHNWAKVLLKIFECEEKAKTLKQL